MCLLRFCFICFFITLTTGEIITLIKDNNITCVATGDDINSTLYLRPVVGNATLKANTKAVIKWSDNWKNRQSFSGIISDRRWQEFKIQRNGLSIKLNRNATYGISLCRTGNDFISITDKQQSNTSIDTNKQNNCEKWNHYKLEVTKYTNTSHVKLFDAFDKELKNETFENVKININTDPPSYWKLHKVNFSQSSSPSNITVTIPNAGLHVLSMFANLSPNSSLKIISAGTVLKTIIGNVTYWQKIDVEINSKNDTIVQIFGECLNVNSNCSWAVGSIFVHLSKIVTYRATMDANTTQQCAALGEANSTNFSKKTNMCNGYIGFDCKISCQEIFDKYEECAKHTMCSESQCSYVWNFWWPHCKTIDTNIKKCSDCQYGYVGNYCSMTLPVLTDKPILKDISNTTIKIQVKNFTFGENEAKPDFYIVQYKQENEQYFKNHSRIPCEKFFYNILLTMDNLTTTESGYIVRILAEVNNKVSTKDVPELKTFKRSLRVKNKTSTSISFEWEPPKNFSYTIKSNCTGIAGCENHYFSCEITNITPRTICKFKLYTQNDELVDKIVATTLSTPPVYSRLQIQENQVVLTWTHSFAKSFYLNITKENHTETHHLTNTSFSFSFDLDVEYAITVWAPNFEKETGTIKVVLSKSPTEFGSKPFMTAWNHERRKLFIPRPPNLETATKALAICVKEKSGDRQWNISEIIEKNNYFVVTIGDGPESAVSLNNKTYEMTLVAGDQKFDLFYSEEETHLETALIVLFSTFLVCLICLGYLIYAYKFQKFPLDIKRQRIIKSEEIPLKCEKRDFSVHYKQNNIKIVREKHPLPAGQERKSTYANYENIDFVDVNSMPIKIDKFEDYLMNALENNAYDNKITRQYKVVTNKKLANSCEVGLSDKNVRKNRFKTLAAYDHTRVVLENDGSDYINANYVDGYEIPKAFIATQAPLPSTLADFWWMVWQEEVTHIIMLTQLEENNVVKCEKYWPEPNSNMRFGQILVVNESENYFSDYVHRCLQYTTWPDHGVPSYPQNFTPFIKRILAMSQSSSPLVVHCNAGFGRTGTLILCDIVLRMAAKEKQVDFVRVLSRMREQRIKLVNNMDQYVFAHFVVLDCLFGKDFSIPINDSFQDAVHTVLRKTTVKPLLNHLEKVTLQYYKRHLKITSSAADENKEKNRFSTILPGASAIFLPISADSSSQYINAVTVDGYRCPEKFIVTQLPLPNTIDDFWKLVKEYEINTVVCLTEFDDKDKSCPKFWSVPCESTNLHLLNEVNERVYDIIKLKITDRKNQYCEKIVNVLRMKEWKSDACKPMNVKDLIVVWKEMLGCSWKGKKSQIVVTCRDGATACGLFVALAYLLEKINFEQICDVFSAVRTVRESREQFVQEWAQLEFLYKAAKVYVEEFDNYHNFD